LTNHVKTKGRSRSDAKLEAPVQHTLFGGAQGKPRENGSEPAAKIKPLIIVSPGNLPQAIDAAENVLVAEYRSLGLYQRGGEIVRVITHLRQDRRERLQVPAGAPVIHGINQSALLDVLNRCINWQEKRHRQATQAADAPPKAAQQYLARRGLWKLPNLIGVIEAPTLRPDGTVLDEPGYDEATGIYLFSNFKWPAIPEKPTRAQAEEALRILVEPFEQFSFVGPEDRSVIISAIFTLLQRRLLCSAPLFAVSAPTQATGKSLLVDALSRIGTGRDAPAAPVSKQTDEMRKMITSILREGHVCVNLDNILDPLNSPDLARAITAPVYADRLLGVSEILQLRTNIVWFATGNNLSFRADIASRALLCHLDSQVEHPELRNFEIKDLRRHIAVNRPKLVAAALTILRAYHVAGRPIPSVSSFGRFEEWSEVARYPLIWLGLADPVLTRRRIMASDHERNQIGAVFSVWSEVFADRLVTLNHAIKTVGSASEDTEGSTADRSMARLRQILLNIAASRDEPEKIDPRRLVSRL
jgi:hypothetical protein